PPGGEYVVGEDRVGRVRVSGEADRGQLRRQRPLQRAVLGERTRGIERRGSCHVAVVRRGLLGQREALRCHQEGRARGRRAEGRCQGAGVVEESLAVAGEHVGAAVAIACTLHRCGTTLALQRPPGASAPWSWTKLRARSVFPASPATCPVARSRCCSCWHAPRGKSSPSGNCSSPDGRGGSYTRIRWRRPSAACAGRWAKTAKRSRSCTA